MTPPHTTACDWRWNLLEALKYANSGNTKSLSRYQFIEDGHGTAQMQKSGIVSYFLFPTD
jgi:hypothetical protein